MTPDELPADMEASTSAPEGEAWRTVPVEPTEAMLDAACENGPDTPAGRFDYSDARNVWQTMLAASPVVPVGREKIGRIIDGIQLTIGDHGPRIRHGERLRATDAIMAALRPTDTGRE
jgi:hypothetical protein